MAETKQDRSLDLDLEGMGRGEKAREAARVIVVGTWGLTRDGGHSTITSDCTTASALQREIDRLHGELDDVRERGCTALGESADNAAKQRAARGSSKAAEPGPASSREKPRLTLAWTVADVMTQEVKTVGPNDPVAAAKALMDAGSFRHVVVVDEDGGIQGVLSHRDLFFGPLAWSIGQGKTAYEKLLQSSRVKDLMHGDVATIDSGAPLQEAAAVMREQKIGCLPVLSGDRLVGLLTEGDFVALVAEANR
jgi:CBS domain-containing membrane protein